MTLVTRATGLLAAVVLALAGCSDAGGSSEEATLAVDRESTSSTGAPTTEATTTTSAEPPVIISAGDSIIYDVSPVLVDALDPDVARVVPLVAPAMADASTSVLRQRIVDERADLTILMVGVWERVHETAGGHELGEPGFREEYRAEALDPLRDAAAQVGGDVLLLGPPHLRDSTAEAQINQLEASWREYAAEVSNVDFIDADTWLGDHAGFIEITPTNDGQTVRLRRLDGIHLCEEGVRRIAAGLMEFLSEMLASPPHAGWEQGDWTSRFPADECPPVT
ncbi:MAG: hypothetical protein U5K30_00100 [Acidimicrobiales bacterium]|nr:hypothetical protein [Acidimicrobiales bacterium]